MSWTYLKLRLFLLNASGFHKWSIPSQDGIRVTVNQSMPNHLETPIVITNHGKGQIPHYHFISYRVTSKPWTSDHFCTCIFLLCEQFASYSLKYLYWFLVFFFVKLLASEVEFEKDPWRTPSLVSNWELYPWSPFCSLLSCWSWSSR